MVIAFTAFFKRLVSATDIHTQTALAEALELNRSAITQAKRRNAVPQKWLLALARRYGLSPDWLEFGTGLPYLAPQQRAAHIPQQPASRQPPPACGHEGVGMPSPEQINFATPHSSLTAKTSFARSSCAQPALTLPVAKHLQRKHAPTARTLSPAAEDPELVHIPKVRALVCAGGGSYAVEALPMASYLFPRRQLARMGRPESMVFMDVVGDSMEPGVQDGDMVLVDQSNTRISPEAILAVGIEDAIYLKRVETCGNRLVLRADNAAYADMELYGDELDSFRVIGKVVWLCRDLRQAVACRPGCASRDSRW
ncbi:MAG: helix-turn-helix domain-containing protein [Desulfovibrio sp.]|jgi:phage repressor protein C with HTH and peptisase S24 domain|nr:helix-turn-helix domain-containing protein [Desulfovibrio sp.]